MFVTSYSHKTVKNVSLKINESTFIFKEKIKKKKILSNNLLWFTLVKQISWRETKKFTHLRIKHSSFLCKLMRILPKRLTLDGD